MTKTENLPEEAAGRVWESTLALEELSSLIEQDGLRYARILDIEEETDEL